MFDAVLTRGDEVPEQVARTVHRRAAQQKQPRTFGSGVKRKLIAGAEDKHAARFKRDAADRDGSVQHIGRALIVPIGQRHRGARGQHGIGIEQRRRYRDRRPQAPALARDQAQLQPGLLGERQRRAGVMREVGRALLGLLGERDPGLDAE